MSIDDVIAIVRRVHDAERVNLGAGSTRDSRNAFWARAIGIVHHGHPVYNPTPDPQWCIKDGGNGRPQSDDVVVSMPSRQFWDCIGGSGADGYSFRAAGPEILPPEQNVYAPPVPAGSGFAPVATNDVWTPAHSALYDRLKGRGFDVKVYAEQFAFAFPGESWGRKSAGAGRAISPDTIARKLPSGKLFGVKVLPLLNVWGELPAEHQWFAVDAVNHLGDPAPVEPLVPPPAPPNPPAPPVVPVVDLSALEAKLDALMALVQQQRDEVIAAVKGQSYDIDASAGYLGRVRGTIKPKS